MRRILIAAGVLVALAAGAWLALPSLVNVEQFRGLLRGQLEQQLARKVEFGAMQLRLWPLSIELGDLKIGEADDFPTGRPFLAAKSFFVKVQARPLLNKDVRIDSIEIREPQLELVKQGERWNYMTLGRSSGDGQPSQIRLAELAVTNGRLAVTQNGQREEYGGINLELANIAPGQPFQMKLSTALGLSYEGQGNPLRGKLRAKDVAIPKQYRVNDKLSGEADLDSQGTVISAKGNAKLEKMGLASTFDVKQDTDKNATKLERVRLAMGESAIVLSGALDDLAVRVEKLTFPDTVKAAQVLNVKLPAGLTAKGVATGEVRLKGNDYHGRLQASDDADCRGVVSCKDQGAMSCLARCSDQLRGVGTELADVDGSATVFAFGVCKVSRIFRADRQTNLAQPVSKTGAAQGIRAASDTFSVPIIAIGHADHVNQHWFLRSSQELRYPRA